VHLDDNILKRKDYSSHLSYVASGKRSTTIEKIAS